MKTEFLLTKTFTFEAAHRLVNHDGKCARLHGHSFKLTIVVAGANIQNRSITTITDFEPQTVSIVGAQSDEPQFSVGGIVKDSTEEINPKANMLLDYGDISALVKPFVEEKLDHHFLNETLETDSPTSEFIASYVFGYFSQSFREKGVELREIRVSETCTSEAIYRKKPPTISEEIRELLRGEKSEFLDAFVATYNEVRFK